ncbi:hypothetical protein ICW40_14350 [Actinotalea ferrariae]|uniref:SitI3 family protein n=1 Tax=Actinotalea ferrariae TaxID=1386098 RepID=UPI001C8B6651|nr:SitI3 family protein [Actinotalea ferrariae]MBX9245986.1 hypothetical protein [Actinotalea ferrariae]
MLDYPTAIATTRDPSAIRSELSTAVVRATAELAVPEDVLSAAVSELTSPVSAELYSDLLGMPATCRVTFHVDNKATGDDTYLAAYPAMGLAAIRLGEVLDAEMCLTFQLDRVVMRRRGGSVVLYDWFRWWSSPELAPRLARNSTMTSDDGRI